ncbi:MAG: hypothetical protein EOM19_07580 [Candidatus Moranbacteria bacterium]|nr:hypothetical protein [Candidatus Moranbacteria bacterium]
MKKWFRVSIIGVFVIFLSGCSLSKDAQKEESDITSLQENSSSQERETEDVWGDALARGEKLRCSYDEEVFSGMNMLVLFFDGEKYRMEYGTNEDPMVNLFDGEAMYSWNERTKSGFFLKQECVEKFREGDSSGETLSQNKYYESAQDVMGGYAGISCEKISEVDIQVPGDISFEDQCSFLEMQMENRDQIESLQQQVILPEGIEMVP